MDEWNVTARVGQKYNGGRGNASGNQSQGGGGQLAGSRKATPANSTPPNSQHNAMIANSNDLRGPPKFGRRHKTIQDHLMNIGWDNTILSNACPSLKKSDISKAMSANAVFAGQNAEIIATIAKKIGMKNCTPKSSEESFGKLTPRGEDLVQKEVVRRAAEKAEKEAEEKEAERKEAEREA